MIHNIIDMPQVISIGVQSEQGVKIIGFNLQPWLGVFPGMKFKVMPTRPGETEAYPANDQVLIGSVLYWYPDGYDTEISGEGKVEIVGTTDDQRKLSGYVPTIVNATSLGATKEPGEAAAPWYHKILAAAEKIEQAATTIILPPTDLVPMDGMFSQPNPWVQDMAVGGVYEVTYNGTVYECEAYDYHDMEPSAPEEVLILGNIALTGGTGGNPDAPFVMLAYPNSAGAEAGLYGMLNPGDDATAVTLGIAKKGSSTVGTQIPQITLTIAEDGTIAADTAFAAAWAMTDAELMAALTIAQTGEWYNQQTEYHSSASAVTRMEHPTMDRCLQIRYDVFTDQTDAIGVPIITRVINWTPARLEQYRAVIQSLPDMAAVAADGAPYYMRHDGKQWTYCTIDQLKEDLGLTGGETTTEDVFYTADGQVFTDVNGAVLHVQKGEA